MTDKNKTPGNSENPIFLPPKICERLRGDVLSAVTKVREPELRETHRPESSKGKLKVGLLLWLLIVISGIIFVLVFFDEPIKGWLNKSATDQAEGVPGVSSMPIRPLKPRVSMPVPTDAEMDAAPVPPVGNDRSPGSTKI